MTLPTAEQIEAAREWLNANGFAVPERLQITRIESLAALIAARVAAEREACLRIAEFYNAKSVEIVIRSRGGTAGGSETT